MLPTLLLGYGNPDRQDDGVAWHILANVARQLGVAPLPPPGEDFPPGGGQPDLLFALQLTPEMAETIAGYARVCFVDAHTGAIPSELQMIPLKGEFQRSPFTHHLTAESCLALCQNLYHKHPESILVSVQGYQFGFAQSLSERTQELAAQAAQSILQWLAS